MKQALKKKCPVEKLNQNEAYLSITKTIVLKTLTKAALKLPIEPVRLKSWLGVDTRRLFGLIKT